MKTNYLIAAFLITSATTFAQTTKPRVAINVGVGNSFNLTSQHSNVNRYHAIEGKINAVLNDKWMVGYAQSGSIYPGDLLKDASPMNKKSKINTHTLTVGRKWNVGDRVYLTGGVNFGISEFKTRSNYESDWDELFDSHASTSFLAGTDTGLGFNFNKYLAAEVGVNYRRYFENERLAINVKDMNSLGFNVSLIGKLNLTK